MPLTIRRVPNLGAMVALAGFLATTVAVSLWTLGHVKDALVYVTLHDGITSRWQAIQSILGPIDAALLALALLSVMIIWRLEVRTHLFDRLLRTMTAVEAWIILTMFAAWTGHCYLFPGVLLGGDSSTHISRFLEVQIGIAHRTLPAWTNYQYMGAPLLWFTGPLTYVVGGALSFLLNDATTAAKLLLFGLHMASAWLFYLLLLRFGTARTAAVLASICFSGSFAILHLFLYRGVFPQAFTIAFLVTLFYAADGLLRGVGKSWGNMLLFSLSTAGLIINHQPHALFAATYLLIFAIAAFLTGWWALRRAPLLIVAGILGVITSVVAVLPTIAEADWVMISTSEVPFSLQFPTFVRLSHLVIWRDTRTTWGFDYWAYLGIGLVIGAMAGLFGLFRNRLAGHERRIVVCAMPCLIVGLFLYNQVVRDIIFLVFFLSIVAGFGLDLLLFRSGIRGKFVLLLVALIIADVMSTAVQPVARTDKAFLIDAGKRLQEIAPNQRVIQVDVEPDVPLTADVGPDNSAAAYETVLPRLAGNHNMAATHVHNYAVTVIKEAEAELRADGRLNSATTELLSMFNVGAIICSSPIANGCPNSVLETIDDPVLGRFIPIKQATPVIFSQRLVQQDVGASLEKPMLWEQEFYGPTTEPRITTIRAGLATWRANEDVDLATRLASAIAVKERPDAGGTTAPTGNWHPVLVSYQEGLEDTHYRISSDKPGFVQLAQPYYPGMQVTVNGSPVKPTRGTLDFMVVKIPDGETVILVQPFMTRIEKTSLAISIFGLFATILVSVWLAVRPMVSVVPGVEIRMS